MPIPWNCSRKATTAPWPSRGTTDTPNATPVNYILVGDKLYLHSAPYGYKIECLQRDPKCCFTAILSTETHPQQDHCVL